MATIKMTKEDKAREEKWKVESAMDTIRRYAEIQKDKSLMSKVKQAAQEQVKMLSNMTKSTPARSSSKSSKKK